MASRGLRNWGDEREGLCLYSYGVIDLQREGGRGPPWPRGGCGTAKGGREGGVCGCEVSRVAKLSKGGGVTWWGSWLRLGCGGGVSS